MLRFLTGLGIKSDYVFAAGFASIVLSFASHFASRPNDGKAQADRWGIFVGQWAPTFFALGTGLKMQESQDALEGKKK